MSRLHGSRRRPLVRETELTGGTAHSVQRSRQLRLLIICSGHHQLGGEFEFNKTLVRECLKCGNLFESG